jgi:hypothetical protein
MSRFGATPIIGIQDSAIFTDPFTRADNTTIGNGWNQAVGDVNSMQISSNRYINRSGSNTGFVGYILRPETFSNDQFSKATLITAITNAAGTIGYCGLCIRASGTVVTAATFNGYALLIGPTAGAGNGSRLVKFVNARLDTLDNGVTNLVTGLTAAPNDVFEIQAIGTTIRALKNGSQIASVVDATHTVGVAGFVDPQGVTGGDTQTYTNTWDDWSGGNTVSGVIGWVGSSQPINTGGRGSRFSYPG